MSKRLIDWILNNRVSVLLGFIAVMALGVHALTKLPVDAVPDITPVQVMVNTKTGALDPEQIEKTVSLPIETEMSGIPRVEGLRSLSKYGLSQVIIVFEDGTDIYWARQQVSERVQSIKGELPEALSPELAPISTGLGEVFMYTVLAKPGSALAARPEKDRLLELRTIQDFVVAPYLKRTVKNVAEVDSTGGYKKEIHVDIHPDKLERHGLTLEQLVENLEGLGENFGGGYIQPGGKQVIVRTSGRIHDLNQIGELSLKLDLRGRPVRLSSVADVREDHSQRMGGATYDGAEAVLGTVLMLTGANSRQVAIDVEEALTNVPVPPDVELRPLYSRSFLVNATLKTVSKNLVEGAALVVAVLFLILGNFRAAILVSLAIPISMLFGIVGMKYFGISASLMSLGAIDFGLLVDGAVVMIENTLRRMEEHRGHLGAREKLELVRQSATEVVKPVTLGLGIIMLVYVPILSLEGVEGKLFHPMAITVLVALAASLLVAVLLMPILAAIALRQPSKNSESRIFSALHRVYSPALSFSLNRPLAVVVPAALLLAGAAFVTRGMGSDFMPRLDEGDLVINLTRESDIGVDASLDMQRKSDEIIKGFGEVEHVFSRLGTPETATDPMGVHLSDTFVILKKNPRDWPLDERGRRRSKTELYAAMKESLESTFPSQEVAENQPIEMRFAEILEGSRADVTLRIYGKELPVLIDLIEKSVAVLETIPGTEEAEMDALTALRKSPVLSAEPNYTAVARHGIDVHHVNRLLETAMGGKEIGSYYENQWRFPIVARVEEKSRENIDAIRRLPVGLPDGGSVPLEMVADFENTEEVTTIAHDFSQRYAAVAVFLSGRDISSYVKEAQKAIRDQVPLPEGYTFNWGGQFKNLERARARLVVIVPVILGGILLILWKAFSNLRHALLVYTAIPLALPGGIFALAIRGIPLSVSASVGFIALMGIAILNSMVMVTFFNQLRMAGASGAEAARQGALVRLRPVAMTALVASLGFIPMAINTGLGAEVQRPLATVVIGGLITSTLLTLLVLPALYAWMESRRIHPNRPAAPPAARS